MTTSRWADRTPTAYAHRAAHALLSGLPEWARWLCAWAGLLGAMVAAWYVLVIVLAAAVELT
jgi:hypothetical protein